EEIVCERPEPDVREAPVVDLVPDGAAVVLESDRSGRRQRAGVQMEREPGASCGRPRVHARGERRDGQAAPVDRQGARDLNRQPGQRLTEPATRYALAQPPRPHTRDPMLSQFQCFDRRRQAGSELLPYTTLFRSEEVVCERPEPDVREAPVVDLVPDRAGV